ISESSNREANKLYGNVRWLNLIAAVAPLLGLLGTVWGMIQAFYDTTQLLPGQNKAEVLAQGIYTALVTTLSGLIIAIPSAVLAHFFDNRIVNWFHKIEELAASLTPMMEQFEGKVRVATPTDEWPENTAPAANSSRSPSTAREPVDVIPPPSPR
ncbi:MAG: MotA/TolQ/ExbB proton channel family protein, partial [Pirellulaceae bacterium]